MRVTLVGFCVSQSGCLSVPTFSAAARNKLAKYQYSHLQLYSCLIFELEILEKLLLPRVMGCKPSKQAHILQIRTSFLRMHSVHLHLIEASKLTTEGDY